MARGGTGCACVYGNGSTGVQTRFCAIPLRVHLMRGYAVTAQVPPEGTSRLRRFEPRLPEQSLAAILRLLLAHQGVRLQDELRTYADGLRDEPRHHHLEEEGICRVLADLAKFGFQFRVVRKSIYIIPSSLADLEPTDAKEIIRTRLRAGRSLQLKKPATHAFLEGMHVPRIIGGEQRSIDSLIDDGAALAQALRNHRSGDLGEVCDPYLQYADADTRCDFTGLGLMEIWRYFRHTWTNEYRSTPGRSMCFLIRNRARPCHPVMGIIGLANAVFQLRDRDDWMGWTPSSVLARIQADSSYWETYKEAALRTLQENRDSVRSRDLIREIGRTNDPLKQAEKLTRIARQAVVERKRLLEEQYERDGEGKPGTARANPVRPDGAPDWLAASNTPLFKRKRAELLADLLFAQHYLTAFNGDARELLARVDIVRRRGSDPELVWNDKTLGRAFTIAVREMRKNGVATRILDVNVCGATPVYREILGGKLAALSLFAKEIQDKYVDNYSQRPSDIASSMLGAPVLKKTQISLLTTTSLYSVGSSQYNRVRMQSANADLRWLEIGHTEGYGTIHISEETTEVLRRVAVQKAGRRDVNNKFGEGTSPLLRQLRDGLSALNFEANDVLQHNQPRIIYALPLYEGAREDLALNRARPIVSPTMSEIADEWKTRWLAKRVMREEILDRLSLVNTHSVKSDLGLSDGRTQISLPIEEI